MAEIFFGILNTLDDGGYVIQVQDHNSLVADVVSCGED